MKTKRRHELQTNQLADTLGHWIDAVKPYFSWIALGVLAIVAVSVAMYMIDARNAADEGAAWADFFDARAQYDADLLRDVAQQRQGGEAALWAQQSVGDVELDRGVSSLFVDKDEAEAALKRAKSAYREVVDKAPAKSMLRQRALFGLAQTHESLGELDDAKKVYQQVADAWPETMIGKEAASQLAALGEKSTVDLYAYLAEYEPPTRSPLPELPGADRDLFNMDLPERPTSPFSSLNEELDSSTTTTSDDGAGEPADNGAFVPPGGSADSAAPTEEPAAEAPADDKPAESDTDSAAAPAEDGAAAEAQPDSPAPSDAP